MNEQNKELEKLLLDAAEQITPNVMFAGRLEQQLKQAHAPRQSFQLPSLKQVFSVLVPTVAVAVFALLVVLMIQKMRPDQNKTAAPDGAQTPSVPVQPTPDLPTYDRGGITTYLSADFPQAPETMKVYLVRDEKMATAESVRALAKQFKMNGEIYELPGQLGTSGMLGSNVEFLAVDGNRQLRVRSDRYFIYIPDYVAWTTNPMPTTSASKEAAIREFMQTYGFDSGYRVEKIGDAYAALALSPDGFGVANENFQVNGLQFSFNQNGIASVSASLLSYDEVANLGIISAEEAFQNLLKTDYLGSLEDRQSGGYTMIDDKIIKPEDIKIWTHVYPLDETLPYNGWLSSTPKSVDGGAPLVLLDGYTVTGNVGDISENMSSVYVEARGKFHNADGVKTFELETSNTYDGYDVFLRGTLRRDGDQFIFETMDTGETYILRDVPADIPLPMDPAFINGIARGDVFDWKVINNSGGGGGGGGGGGYVFYSLNLSGTPVPFPTPLPATPTPAPTLEKVAGLRGTLQVTIFHNVDGTQTVNYLLIPYANNAAEGYPYTYLLNGNVDAALNAYHNRPIDVWGTLGGIENGQMTLTVERYEVPYPDLKFQLIGGSQENQTIDGQDVLLVTADDGITYIALNSSGNASPMPLPDVGKAPIPGSTEPYDPNEGRRNYEALIIPGETLLGYPGMRIFGSAPEAGPDAPPMPMEIMSDQPNEFPGAPPPTAMTIEQIELTYFVFDQRYPQYTPLGEISTDPVYVQPVWKFSGRYEDGSAFQIYVQALRQEFLLPPEPIPAISP